MKGARKTAWALVAAGVAIGTLSDRSSDRQPVTFDEYRVLAGDFHTHAHPLSGSMLTPFDIAIEAQRQELDVVAMTPHNGALAGRAGQWFAERIGGITVIPGEEVHGPWYHLIALGTRQYISWRLPAAEAIDEVHLQRGVAIAAHPAKEAWASYDDATARKLDGAEALQPTTYISEPRGQQMVEFWKRSGAAAIGSSDHHGMGPLGLCRTYVFARDASEAAVLEAIRERRTVAFDGTRAYGSDARLVEFVRGRMKMPERPSPIGAALALVGLLGLILL